MHRKRVFTTPKEPTSWRVRATLVTLTYLAAGFHVNADGYKRFSVMQCNIIRFDMMNVEGLNWWCAAATHIHPPQGQRVYWEKSETKPHHTVYTKASKRGWELKGLLFGSCKFIPIICLQLGPVCTVCLQSGAINVIVRGCSCLRCLSSLSLTDF